MITRNNVQQAISSADDILRHADDHKFVEVSAKHLRALVIAAESARYNCVVPAGANDLLYQTGADFLDNP